MSESRQCPENERLVGLLYEELEAADRDQIERHLASCESCRREIDELRGVRRQLQAWSPPSDGIDLAVVPARELRWARRWAPAVGLAAAAVLVLAVGAAVANVEVRVGPGEVVIRTGWFGSEPEPAPTPVAAAVDEPWRAEVAAVERRLRAALEAEQRAALRAAPAPDVGARPVSGAALDRRVRSLIAESEGKQQRELALRMAQLTRELAAQRRSDLVRIERGLGQLEGTAGAEAAQQRELLNYLVRVSQRR